jgi:hypothetical protein
LLAPASDDGLHNGAAVEDNPKNHFFILVSFLPLPIRIRKTV